MPGTFIYILRCADDSYISPRWITFDDKRQLAFNTNENCKKVNISGSKCSKAIETEHYAGASVMSEEWNKKIEELRRDIQMIKNMVQEISLDVTQNQNVTLATSHYLEEVAKMVKNLEDKCPGLTSKHQ